MSVVTTFKSGDSPNLDRRRLKNGRFRIISLEVCCFFPLEKRERPEITKIRPESCHRLVRTHEIKTCRTRCDDARRRLTSSNDCVVVLTLAFLASTLLSLSWPMKCLFVLNILKNSSCCFGGACRRWVISEEGI